MILIRHLLLLAILCAAGATTATAGRLPAILSAPEAYAMQKAGELLVVDIRSPREWRETGVARNAVTITVHQRSFAKALLDAVDGDRSRPIAIICATGARTAVARKYLEKMGFTAVADISEGMLGSADGPGWIRRGLPVVAYREP